ncbi:FAD-dependent oxidoreductase [Nesterenkonia ebinurensis]|uniref:FAD-dependent oxidoreductase n=1 Tax=Nesterenkonia ebinurensis TaxID=2608252 RepID=UPI00123D6AA6|nr:FAD-dependent oxidoreductase [Nesterenkonia ebinurensis]
MRQKHCDVVVIGAGPAGLAAASQASGAGAQVLLIDQSLRPGGQFWRHASEEHDADPGRWHHGWNTYTQLAKVLERAIGTGRVEHLSGHHVLTGERTGTGLGLTVQPVPELADGVRGLITVEAPAVVLCPGAYDRQLPVPGWTLPGVMAAGGVQAFIKTQGAAPGRRAVLAGTGPFLLSAAASVIQAGGEVAAVCEAADLTGWVPHGVAAALVPSKGLEGAEYISLLAKHRVPYLRRTAVTAIHGEQRAEKVTVSRLDRHGAVVAGTEKHFNDVDLVGLGWGFVPQSELVVQFGAQTRIDIDGSLIGVVDTRQHSSVEGLYLAGEITGVAGATAAVAEGRIAGYAAAWMAGYRVRGARQAAAAQRDKILRANHRAFARAMHTAHPLPAGWESWMQEETTVCRCEEVPYHRIRESTETLSAQEPRGLKGTTRTGMGWCQGRICGAAAICLAKSSGDQRKEQAARAVAKRPLAAPVRLSDLAESRAQTRPLKAP